MTGTRTFLAMVAVGALMTAACGEEAAEAGDSGIAAQTTSTASDAGLPDTTLVASTAVDEPADRQGGEDSNQNVERLSGEGTFSVDGEQSETEWVVSCAPSDDFGGNPDERDLQLIAYSSEGGFLTLEVGVEDLEGLGESNYTYNTFVLDWGQSVEEVSIEGFRTSPDGDWYFGVDTIQLARGTQTADPLDRPPFTMEGDRIVGSVDIAAIDPEQPDGVTVTFDLSIPPERFDCSQL